MYDRETGKPKGYGFCEYQDQETALSAMRNLNGREFSGRALRVDNAASEKNKEELKSKTSFLFNTTAVFYVSVLIDVLIWCVYATGLGTGAPTIESPYGDSVQPQEAPESISRAVASLPPEQMFELMKQMKVRTFATRLFYNHELLTNINSALSGLKEIIFPALKMLVFTGQSLNAAGGNISLHNCFMKHIHMLILGMSWVFFSEIYTDSEQKSYV